MAIARALAALRRRLRDWRAALLYDDIPGVVTRPGHDAGRDIPDGAVYRLPVVMPREVRQAWSHWSRDRRIAYLAEADRTNWHFQFDSLQRTWLDAPVTMPAEDPLGEWDSATRRSVLESCHLAYMRNPIIKAAVDYTAAFVVGSGLRISTKNRDVRYLLDEFCKLPDNPVRELERQLVIDLQVDGELFIRFFSEDGQTVIAPLRPWEVDWVETEPGFFRRVLSYHVTREISDGKGGWRQETEDIPAEQVLHVAINRRAYEQRGRPDLYPVLPWAKAYRDWLEDRARQNYWRGALLYTVSVDTTNPATVAAVAARWRKPPAPGSVAVESSRVAINAVTNTSSAGDVSEDGRQLKLMTAVGLRVPEYMLSDGENANLATTSSQELPALTKFAEFQRIMAQEVWEPVFRRVLRNAVLAGILPDVVPAQDEDGNDIAGAEPISVEDAFSVLYEPLIQVSPVETAKMLEIAYGNQWVSARTAALELGFDYSKEMEQINAEAEMAARLLRDRIASGLVPPQPGLNALGEPVEEEPEETEA